MIAGIEKDSDISVFLEEGDFEKICDGIIVAGIMVRSYWPYGNELITLNYEKSNIDLVVNKQKSLPNNDEFITQAHIGDPILRGLRKYGCTSTRYTTHGSKFNISNRLDNDSIVSIDRFKLLRDNVEKIGSNGF